MKLRIFISINYSKLANYGGVTNNYRNDLFGMQLLYNEGCKN